MMDRSKELWDRARHHRGKHPGSALEYAWNLLDRLHYKGVIDRDKLHELSDNPLAAVFFLIEMEFYPPPELLLALKDAYDEYLEAPLQGKKMTLEEAFFGKPSQRGGNYAKKKYKDTKLLTIQFRFGELLDQGFSRADAAEKVSNLLGGSLDADTILRMLRRSPGFVPKAD